MLARVYRGIFKYDKETINKIRRYVYVATYSDKVSD